jgi:TolB protein
LSIRTLSLPALIVAAVLLACAAVVLAVSREVEATFPGKNGKIAYVAFRVTNGTAEIYTINPGGGGKTQITHNNNDEFSLSYSPNGKKIVYVSGYVNEELYTIDASGGGKTQLTHNNKADYDPDYSPDGKRIVYEGSDTFGDLNIDKAESDIYTIKAGGGDKTHVTNTDNVDEYMPSWGSRP